MNNSNPKNFKPVTLSQKSLPEQIAESVQEMIVTGEFKVGDRLPTVRDMTILFNVNASTIREALKFLQQRGLIESKVGSGTFIRAVPLSVVGIAFQDFFVSSNSSYLEIAILRYVLEPRAASLAASHATEDEIEQLKHLTDHLTSVWTGKDEDLEATVDADMEFHLAVAHTSQNASFMAILTGVWSTMRNVFLERYQGFRTIHNPDASAHRAHMHRRIYEAIAARDPLQAKEAMRLSLRDNLMDENRLDLIDILD